MMEQIAQGRRGRTVLGFPLEGFSLFQSLLLAVASAFLTFFATTCVSIFALLAWNVLGGHTVSYVDTYLLCRVSRGRAGAGCGAAVLLGVVGACKNSELSARLFEASPQKKIKSRTAYLVFPNLIKARLSF